MQRGFLYKISLFLLGSPKICRWGLLFPCPFYSKTYTLPYKGWRGRVESFPTLKYNLTIFSLSRYHFCLISKWCIEILLPVKIRTFNRMSFFMMLKMKRQHCVYEEERWEVSGSLFTITRLKIHYWTYLSPSTVLTVKDDGFTFVVSKWYHINTWQTRRNRLLVRLKPPEIKSQYKDIITLPILYVWQIEKCVKLDDRCWVCVWTNSMIFSGYRIKWQCPKVS